MSADDDIRRNVYTNPAHRLADRQARASERIADTLERMLDEGKQILGQFLEALVEGGSRSWVNPEYCAWGRNVVGWAELDLDLEECPVTDGLEDLGLIDQDGEVAIYPLCPKHRARLLADPTRQTSDD